MYEFERPPYLVYADPDDVKSPRIRQLHHYWRSKCDGSRLPARSSIEPGDIRALLPHLILAELGSEPFRITYRLVGTAVAKNHKSDFTGRDHDEVDSLQGSGLDAAYRQAQQTGAPIFGRSGLGVGDNSWITFEYGIFPLSEDGITVNKCLVIEWAGEVERTASPRLADAMRLDPEAPDSSGRD